MTGRRLAMSGKRIGIVVLMLAVAGSLVLPGGEAEAGEGAYRVAVLPFDASRAKDATTREWGAQIGDLLAGLLTVEPGLEILERAKMGEMLKEHSLNLTGLTSSDDQIKIGKLVGAQFIVVGRVFPIDRDICVVAKVVSVETSKMKAEVVQGPLSGNLAPLVKMMAGRVANTLRRQGPALLPKSEDEPDGVGDLRKAMAALKGKGYPRFLVSIPESHISFARAVPDPAAATEFLIMMKFCRLDVSEDESAKKTISTWARDFLRDSSAKVPKQGIGDVDIILVGEGISQFGARNGNIITCIGRLEVQAVDVKTGKILAVGRKTVRKADIAETIAAKTALQHAAGQIAVKLIPDAIAEWRALHK